MTAQYWEPGTQYNYGDVVQYEGHRYKIIQPHFSQSDWAPGPATAALWGRLSDEDNNYCGDNKQQQQGHEQQQSYQQQPQQQQGQQQAYGSEHEEKKHWYEDEETKKKLEIGGGLAAGAALLAGGLFAYKKHEEHKEQGKAEGWAHGNWIQEAKAHTESFYRNGTNEPATWVLTQGQTIPRGAILVGREHSWNLYICRAFHDNSLQVGKASEAFQNGGVLGYKNKEVFVNDYEVLVGDMDRLIWVPTGGRLNLASLGYRAVEGGRENDGTRLYIAEAPHKDAVHPGKASENLDGAYIAYDGKEKNVKEYRVLCYRN
ncbi:carbohydrate-binding module family 12 protein [Phlegmacium glaucopus]|nr:carbohydrate-binding module family 12 protein [Phlegmacium glaucopus]